MADILVELAKVMLPLSLASIGGGATITAGVGLVVVQKLGWLTPAEFIHIFAVSRAAPGPGTMIATLVGWKVAGFPGAMVASAAIYGPTSLLAYVAFRLANAHRETRWHQIVRRGLAPVGTGLVIAAVWSLFRAAQADVVGVGLALASFLALQLAPKLPAIAILICGGIAMTGLQMAGLTG